jgi:hypothetical protein
MAPTTAEETKQLMIDALAALNELGERTRTEVLESQGWADLLTKESPQLNERLKDYFDWCAGKKEENPGDLLEEIAYLLFQCFIGVGNVRSFQSYAPQHDLVVDGDSTAWVLLMNYLHLPVSGRTVIVECKNQEKPITDQQFSRLCGILQNKFQDTAHLGIFISHTPATGFPKKGKGVRSLRDSRATQALFHAKTNKYVVVINHDDLVSISKGANFSKILEAKIREVEASTGISLEFDEEWKETLLPPHLLKHRS